MTLYRIFEGKDKKKCYVKNVRGKALSAIEITARNAVRPTSHFSEEEIKAFGLEDHEREVVTGISLVEKAQEKFKDAEEPHYVVFVPFTKGIRSTKETKTAIFPQSESTQRNHMRTVTYLLDGKCWKWDLKNARKNTFSSIRKHTNAKATK